MDRKKEISRGNKRKESELKGVLGWGSVKKPRQKSISRKSTRENASENPTE